MARTESATGTVVIEWAQGLWPVYGEDTHAQEAKAWAFACAVAWEAVREANSFDVEVCGYVERVHNDHPDIHILVVQVDNVTEEDGEFAFDEETCKKVYDLWETDDLLGIWHSHPRGQREPSILDWEGHPRHLPMFIVALDPDSKGTQADDCRATVLRYDEEARP